MSRNIQKALQCSYLEPVISKNITNYAKPVISRWYHSNDKIFNMQRIKFLNLILVRFDR